MNPVGEMQLYIERCDGRLQYMQLCIKTGINNDDMRWNLWRCATSLHELNGLKDNRGVAREKDRKPTDGESPIGLKIKLV